MYQPLAPKSGGEQVKHCEIVHEAPGTQVEVLKAPLQKAEQHVACQEEKVTERSTRQETETKQIKPVKTHRGFLSQRSRGKWLSG